MSTKVAYRIATDLVEGVASFVGERHFLNEEGDRQYGQRKFSQMLIELPSKFGDGRSVKVLVCPNDFSVFDLDDETGGEIA